MIKEITRLFFLDDLVVLSFFSFRFVNDGSLKKFEKKKKFRFPLDGEGQNEIRLMDATWHAKTLVGIIHQGYVGDSINGIRLSSVGLASWIGSLLLWRGQWWNSIDRDIAKEKKKKTKIECIKYINKILIKILFYLYFWNACNIWSNFVEIVS